MFKIIVSLALFGVALADVSHLFNHGGGLHGQVRPPVVAHKAVSSGHYQPGNEAHVQILRQESDIQPDGSYSWSYETENGINAQEQAHIQQAGPETAVKSAQGSFSWTSPEGQPIQISYVADENGYQPQGDLPTPPPIPAAIQRALDWIAAHPQQQHQQEHRPQAVPVYQNQNQGHFAGNRRF